MSVNRKISILVLDDDEISRGTISKLMGYKLPHIELYAAGSCRAGFKLCKMNKIDMIISGIEKRKARYQLMVNSVRRANKKARLLLIANNEDGIELAHMAQELGVSLVQIPVDLQELLSETRSTIAKIEKERAEAATK